MKKIIYLILICLIMATLVSCKEADAIKDGIKDKLPKPEEYEITEAIMEKPVITMSFEHQYSLLVIQEVSDSTIIAVLEDAKTLYSIPNWFGNKNLEVGTYLLVEHADNSLPTNPMQFGFIYQVLHYAKDGQLTEGIKP